MFLTQWLRQMVQRWSPPGGNRRGRVLLRKRPRVRPQLEVLEDRLTPSGNVLGLPTPDASSPLQQGAPNAGASKYTANFLASSSAPTVTTQPTNQTVTSGQSATFTAAASGSPTPTVQWQYSSDGGKTFTNISGATDLMLTLNHVSTPLSGDEFRAVFTNSSGSATSNAAMLTVNPLAPAVTNQPNSKTVPSGNTASFTAAASGDPAPTVQWQYSSDGGKTFTNISGATDATLTLSSVSLAMSGDEFRAVFTNSGGSATSNAATLTVTAAPSITTQPSNQTVTAGQTATFTAAASGGPAPRVQWQVSSDGGKTFTNINGATSTTLTLIHVATSINGDEFRAVFTNSSGTATTDPATLTVHPLAPSITTQPTNQTVTAGQTAVFSAAASGDPAPTVQWQYSSDGGKTFTTISGVAGTTLTVNHVSTTFNGDEFRAVFTNSGGSATTNIVTLTVNPLAPAITTQPSNRTVISGNTVSFTAAASGDPVPTVQWQYSSDGGKTFTNISGATNATLTLSQVTTALNGDEFRAVFTNKAGSATSNAATLTVNPLAPKITSQPSNQKVAAGSSVSFTATAGGDPAPTVQWQISTDGGSTFTNIAGATNITLTLANVTTTASGDEFRAVFTNSGGSVASRAATLTVSPLPSPNPVGSAASGSGQPLSAPPPLHIPPLLALIDSLLTVKETVNANGTVTLTDSFFGFPLLVATFNSSGNLVSVTMFGIDITLLFELPFPSGKKG